MSPPTPPKQGLLLTESDSWRAPYVKIYLCSRVGWCTPQRNQQTTPAPGLLLGTRQKGRRVPFPHDHTASAFTIKVCQCRDCLRNNLPKICSKHWFVNSMFNWGRAGNPDPRAPPPFTWPRGSEQAGVAWSKPGGALWLQSTGPCPLLCPPWQYTGTSRAGGQVHQSTPHLPTWEASPSPPPGPSLRDGLGSTSKAHPGQEAVSAGGSLALRGPARHLALAHNFSSRSEGGSFQGPPTNLSDGGGP